MEQQVLRCAQDDNSFLGGKRWILAAVMDAVLGGAKSVKSGDERPGLKAKLSHRARIQQPEGCCSFRADSGVFGTIEEIAEKVQTRAFWHSAGFIGTTEVVP